MWLSGTDEFSYFYCIRQDRIRTASDLQAEILEGRRAEFHEPEHVKVYFEIKDECIEDCKACEVE